MASELHTVGLYGGAITVELPSDFVDASRFRHIPDNQEVYVSSTGTASVVVELLEQQPVSDAEAIDYFFTDLCETNEAVSSSVGSKSTIDPATCPGVTGSVCSDGAFMAMLEGQQVIYKWGRDKGGAEGGEGDTVEILLLLIRMPVVKTDLLISFNVPLATATGDSEAGHLDAYREMLARAAQSIRILDASLFGSDGGE